LKKLFASFHGFNSSKIRMGAGGVETRFFMPDRRQGRLRFAVGTLGSGATIEKRLRYLAAAPMEEMPMKKTLAVLATVATLGSTAVSAPAEARGIGPGLAFGLAAGAIAAGAFGAYGPYYYGPGYGYYGYPAYYDYGPGPYAYYDGGPYYYRHRYWRHRHYW
jgi:hypothetical protein